MELVRISPLGQNFYSSAAEFLFADARAGAKTLVSAAPEGVQLVYIDPPYFTGKDFYYRARVGEAGFEKRGGDAITHVAFSDKFPGGMAQYLDMMREVIQSAHAALHQSGSIFVHVDYRASAHLRLLLDEIFGEQNLVNELIWSYQSGGRSKRAFSRKHDTILFYRKSKAHYFDIEAAPLKDKARNNHMRRQVDADGRSFRTIRSGGKLYTYYDDAPAYPSDVWDDISHLQQKDPERTLYDTQKPLALLGRIISVSTREGDLVADFFAGSGTTLLSAAKLNRRAFGCDSSPHSMNTIRERMIEHGGGIYIRLNDIPDGGKVELSAVGVCVGNAIELKVKDFRPGGDRVDGLDALQFIGVGQIVDGKFVCKAHSCRTQQSPALETGFRLEDCKGEQVGLMLVDVYGGNHFYRVDESPCR